MPKLLIAGIGSRKTPPGFFKQCEKVGRFIRESGGFLRSGHSKGADYAFEKGSREHTIIYIPWKDFGNRNIPLTPHIVDISDRNPTPKHHDAFVVAAHSVRKFHPNPDILEPYAKKLLARNYLQIHGINDKRVDAVVCYAQPKVSGDITGGTGHTLKIARAANVPILNLYELSLEAVLDKLQDLAKAKMP